MYEIDNIYTIHKTDKPFWLAYEDNQVNLFNYNINKNNFKIKFTSNSDATKYEISGKDIKFYLSNSIDNHGRYVVEITDIQFRVRPYIIVKEDRIHMRINQKYISYFDPILLHTTYLSLYTNQDILITSHENFKNMIHCVYNRFLDMFIGVYS